MDGRFAISMHILTLLAHADSEWVPSEYLAGSININPALVRKEISNLRQHGLVVSKEGKNGGSKLAKPASQIQLSDVFDAVRHDSLLGAPKNKPNPQCPIGRQISQHLTNLNQEAEKAVRLQLGIGTLESFLKQFS